MLGNKKKNKRPSTFREGGCGRQERVGPEAPPCFAALPLCFFATSENVNSFFFYSFFRILNWFRQSAVPGSDSHPSNPRHQPSFDKRETEPFINKRWIRNKKQPAVTAGRVQPAPPFLLFLLFFWSSDCHKVSVVYVGQFAKTDSFKKFCSVFKRTLTKAGYAQRQHGPHGCCKHEKGNEKREAAASFVLVRTVGVRNKCKAATKAPEAETGVTCLVFSSLAWRRQWKPGERKVACKLC